MKMKTLLFGTIAFGQSLFCYSQHLQVDGNVLKDTLGNTIILRGINYPIIDDYGVVLSDHASVEARIDQIALTGTNCIRFPWYTNGTHYKDVLNPIDHPNYGPGTLASYVNNGHLSYLLQYTFSKGIIPVLEIHNFTGAVDYDSFQTTVMDFWTDEAVLNIIEENKEYLIINLANEFGFVNYAGDPVSALTQFKNNYITSIELMRNSGVHVPIMIDAPDYGQSSSSLVAIAPAILAADTDQNIIFSVHAYWAVYAPSPAQIQVKMDEMSSLSSCTFLMGEIANTQADAPTYCGELDISSIYPEVLNEACDKNIGWLAWSWNQDCDATREMSNTASFSDLTPYGNDIVNNVNYGLKSTTGCGAMQVYPEPSGIDQNQYQNILFQLTPNPSSDFFRIEGKQENYSVKIITIHGEVIAALEVQNKELISLESLEKGTYVVRIENENISLTKSLIKI
jgi:mannan endo-1,4-beta-mannosidase